MPDITGEKMRAQVQVLREIAAHGCLDAEVPTIGDKRAHCIIEPVCVVCMARAALGATPLASQSGAIVLLVRIRNALGTNPAGMSNVERALGSEIRDFLWDE